MPTKSKSIITMNDCKEVFEAAIASEHGIILKFSSQGQAVSFRHRLNAYRKRDRDRNKQLYDPGTDLYTASEFDTLVCSIPKDPTDAEGKRLLPEVHVMKRGLYFFEYEEIKGPPKDEDDFE